jgi:hypothetical protein
MMVGDVIPTDGTAYIAGHSIIYYHLLMQIETKNNLYKLANKKKVISSAWIKQGFETKIVWNALFVFCLIWLVFLF